MNDTLICLDCLYWHETGSSDGLTSDRYREVANQASGAFIVDTPTDDGYVAFSRRACDACGSDLAGQRFRAITVEEWRTK